MKQQVQNVIAQIYRNRFGGLMVIVSDSRFLHFGAEFRQSGNGVIELLDPIGNWSVRGDLIDPAVDQACCDALCEAGVRQVMFRRKGINLNFQSLADLIIPRPV